MPPKGKGRKSNIEAYRDAMAVVKLVDHDCMEVADAAKALGLSERTAYRLLSRARSILLTPQIEADKKVAAPAVNQWFEVDPSLTTEGEVGPQVDHEATRFVTVANTATLPAVEPVPEPEPEPWEWEHLMSRAEFLKRDPWRQKQLIAGWTENLALSGQSSITLRGKPRGGPCFGNCPMGNCTCNVTEDF
jgi:predicted DNA-binding protein (UPF0251 family)